MVSPNARKVARGTEGIVTDRDIGGFVITAVGLGLGSVGADLGAIGAAVFRGDDADSTMQLPDDAAGWGATVGLSALWFLVTRRVGDPGGGALGTTMAMAQYGAAGATVLTALAAAVDLTVGLPRGDDGTSASALGTVGSPGGVTAAAISGTSVGRAGASPHGSAGRVERQSELPPTTGGQRRRRRVERRTWA